MTTRKREGNRPDRRFAPLGRFDAATLEALGKALAYVGSAHHKLRPGDYGLVPPTNPRASKSACDDKRPLLLTDATALIEFGVGAAPKYVWAVDDRGDVYEAKSNSGLETGYHGYRLGEDDPQRVYILNEWRRRCPKP